MTNKTDLSYTHGKSADWLRSLRQTFLSNLKWIIYGLLFLNLIYYGVEDWTSAQHTLTANATMLQQMSAYAASLDFVGWIVLILIYELETYWLEDDFDNRLLNGLMQTTKIVCYALILQTTYAYLVTAIGFKDVALVQGVTDLCAFAGQDLSFVRNLSYTAITAESCSSIPYSDALYRYPSEPVITDAAGLREEAALSKLDVIENLSWLCVIITTELAVRFQNKGYYDGLVIVWSKRVKYAAYLSIVGAAIYWISKGHYLYAWDEFLWIAGFTALDNNLSAWRDELKEAEHHTSELSPSELHSI